MAETKPCLSLEEIAAFAEGRLVAAERAAAMGHLAGCEECREILAGTLVAPELFLHPGMMAPVLIYAFAAATLGGLESPLGAIVGGIAVGVVENLAGAYIPAVGSEIKLIVALLIIVVVLLARPRGLFGRRELVRA